MTIHVKLFGPLADAVGLNQFEMQEITDTDSLRGNLYRKFPKLKGQTFVMAVYKQICDSNCELQHGDIVALLPPFAGG